MSSVAAIQRGPSTVRQEESKERSNASPVRLSTAMGGRYGLPCQLDTKPNWQWQRHPQACAYGYEFQIAHGRTYPERAAARAKAVPTRHKDGFRRSVAGSATGHLRLPSASVS